jgi:hypothetical protein
MNEDRIAMTAINEKTKRRTPKREAEIKTWEASQENEQAWLLVYIYNCQTLSVHLTVFLQTVHCQKNWQRKNMFLLEIQPQENVNFAAICMSLSPSQFISALFLP